MAEQQQQAREKAQFAIQRMYIKDSSFESPTSPHIFRKEWKPEANVDVNSTNVKLDKEVYEVVLRVTVTVKMEDQTAFLAEVNQAGIFTVKDFDNEHFDHLMGSFCPNILFPYAREAITSMVMRGGFPQLYLAPINFDAVYQQQRQKAASQKETTQ